MRGAVPVSGDGTVAFLSARLPRHLGVTNVGHAGKLAGFVQRAGRWVARTSTMGGRVAMDDGERARAHSLYLRLRRLFYELPPGHPARSHLGAATELARRHWAELVAAREDRLLAQAPMRTGRDLPGGRD